VSFQYFHKQHHACLNDLYDDPDVPSAWEARLFGSSTAGKIAYLTFFALLQPLRTLRFNMIPVDFWLAANWTCNLAYAAFVYYTLGSSSLAFLLVSSIFAIGLHPCGARWIAEHYSLDGDQETYSYYGPINKVAFNIGFHNEHHDFPNIPWRRLPTLKRLAAEFYEPLVQHSSYLGLLRDFFFNPAFTLDSRRHHEKSQ